MSVERFRQLYREPLRRTRNRTIALHDQGKAGALKGGAPFTTETARAAQLRGAAARWSGKSADERRKEMLVVVAGRKRQAPEVRSALASHAGRSWWASRTDEQRQEIKRKLAQANIMKRVAKWPFPDGPKMTRTDALALATKRAAAAAKLRRFQRKPPQLSQHQRAARKRWAGMDAAQRAAYMASLRAMRKPR